MESGRNLSLKVKGQREENKVPSIKSLGCNPESSQLDCWTLTSTMRLVICCLMLLPLVTAGLVRARREDVLSFLNDALSTKTGETMPAIMTGHRNPPSEPEKGQDSQDLSEDQSLESANQETITEPKVSDANLGGESKDLDSDEAPQSKVEDKAPPPRRPGAPLASRRRAQNQQCGERVDPNSEEAVTDAMNVPSRLPVQDTSLQMTTSVEGVRSLDTSRELDVHDGRPVGASPS
ncbi:uncharacterized protein LOC133160834 [Syngnathus typhle]|uniref:uncharacterized protein LOC133160834 n=1 Tax=Syngnathus typhle TaxID=161592 RepID=UPI002A6AA575|nr:uncharacterized protein LOC133160834 [Syngnathus typhle]